jgi:hypothetical protein
LLSIYFYIKIRQSEFFEAFFQARVHTRTHAHTHTHWDIKRGALSLLLFIFDTEHDIKKIQKSQVGLKLMGTHQLLVDTGDVNLLGSNKYKSKSKAITLTSRGGP